MTNLLLSILPMSTGSSVGVFLGTLFITAITLGATFLTEEKIGKKIGIPICSVIIFLVGFVELGFVPQAFPLQSFAVLAVMIANSFNFLVWFYGRENTSPAEAKPEATIHGGVSSSDETSRGDTPMYVARKVAS